MASAKRLESGSWRVQVKKVVDGKTVKKSFTASPKDFPGDAREASRKAKAQAELLARNWIFNAETESHRITVENAMKEYIAKKRQSLSPSTIAVYVNLPKHFSSEILEKDIHEISSKDIQAQIYEFASKGQKAKSIKNEIFFLLGVLSFFEIDKRFKYEIPKTKKPQLNPPEPSEFQRLLSMADNETKLAIILAGLYTLRRGEIGGLIGEDMLWDFNSIHVQASLVKDEDHTWVRSLPKTADSERIIKIDPDIMKLFPRVGPKEYVIKMNPDQITKKFMKLRKAACVNCRFHDLRKYAASIRSEIMPSKYVEADGGWSKDSNVMRTIYDKPFKEKREKYSKDFNSKIVKKYKKELFG